MLIQASPATLAAAKTEVGRKPSQWPFNASLLHPIAQQLWNRAVSVVGLQEGGGYQTFDLKRGIVVSINVSGPTGLKWQGGVHGLELNHGPENSTTYIDLGSDSSLCPDELGIFWYGNRGPSNNTFGSLVERDFTSVANPFYTYRLISTRVADNTLHAQLIYNLTGTTFSTINAVNCWEFGEDGDIGCSIRNGEQLFWINGDLRGSRADVGTLQDYGTPTYLGVSQLFATHESSSICRVVYLFKGGLSEAEYQFLHENPFALITPDLREVLARTLITEEAPPVTFEPAWARNANTVIGMTP